MNKKILKLISQKQDKVDYESNGFDFEEESNDDYPNSEQNSCESDNIKNIKDLKKEANSIVLLGIILFVIGSFVSIFTYLEAKQHGGTYYLLYGLIIYGLIEIIRGVLLQSNISEICKTFMDCPSCNSLIELKSSFCPNCKIELFECSECNHTISNNDKYCPNCKEKFE